MRLTQRYDLLLARAAEGDPARAEAACYDLVGLTPRHTPAVAERVERAALIRYDVPRRVDLVALRRGARSIAKFEDLPRAVADATPRDRRGWETHARAAVKRSDVIGADGHPARPAGV